MIRLERLPTQGGTDSGSGILPLSPTFSAELAAHAKKRQDAASTLDNKSLPSVEDIASHIGLGDLYANRYLYHGHDGKEK